MSTLRGEAHHAAKPEPWLARHLGMLRADASPMEVADYERRAGFTASYREAAGITNPNQAVSPEPHHGNPELENMRQQAIREMEIRDEAAMWAGMDRGQLEAHTAAADRAHAAAPPDVGSQLRATAHAEADAWQQAANAQASEDEAGANNARQLAGLLGTERQALEARNAEHEQWADSTRIVRDNGDKAAAELNRRGRRVEITQDGDGPRPQEQSAASSEPETGGLASSQVTSVSASEPETTLKWLRQFDADLAAVERSIERERHAAIDAGQPWPPARQPHADTGPGTEPETVLSDTEPTAEYTPGARSSEAIADVKQAARQYAAEQASRQVRSDYAARISKEAEAQPEAHAALMAEIPADAEIEL